MWVNSSLQNKIWNLPDRSTILAKFIYDKEGKLAGPTQILPVRVRGPALILKTETGDQALRVPLMTYYISTAFFKLSVRPGTETSNKSFQWGSNIRQVL